LVLEDFPIRIWFAGVLTGKSHVGIRLEEIESIIHFVQEKNPSGGQISIVTKGVLSSDALHAALLFNDAIDALAMINPLASYQSLLEARDYEIKLIQSSVPGAMESYDLPQLVKALEEKKIVLIDPIRGTAACLGPQK
jgi:hypothetical protein